MSATTQDRVIQRDYSITGPEAQRAIDRGLVDADWFHPDVAPERMRELTDRTNGRAIADAALWIALLFPAAVCAWRTAVLWRRRSTPSIRN